MKTHDNIDNKGDNADSTRNPTQSTKAPANARIALGLPQSKTVNKPSSKFDPRYWESRVFRNTYQNESGMAVDILEWRVRPFVAGRRVNVALGTNDKREGSRRAARLYELVKTKGWDLALAEFCPDGHKPKAPEVATIGEFIPAASKEAAIRPRTAAVYAYALRRIAGDIAQVTLRKGSKFDPANLGLRAAIDGLSLSILTLENIESWKESFIGESVNDPMAEQRRKRSANSFIRNARALFSKHIVKELAEKLILPHPAPFEGVEMAKGTGSMRYTSTINASALLQQAKGELDRDTWLVALLGLGAGLRRGEIDQLAFSHIDSVGNRILVMPTRHYELKTNDSEGDIHVDIGMIQELTAGRKPGDNGFIVEPETAYNEKRKPGSQYYRCKETFAKLTSWLRSKGVDTEHPIHTLRKEAGSIIAAASDIHTASSQLRHSNIGTTSAYYADNRRKTTVPIANLLNPPAGPETSKMH